MNESDKAVMQQALDALNSGNFLERTAAVRVLESAIEQPEQPSIKNAELVWPIAQSKWNAQADKYNQWGSLGQDEMSVLIVRETELQLSQIVQFS